MDETVVGIVIGLSALIFALFFAIGHYRRERLRSRMLSKMHGQHRLYDLPDQGIERLPPDFRHRL